MLLRWFGACIEKGCARGAGAFSSTSTWILVMFHLFAPAEKKKCLQPPTPRRPTPARPTAEGRPNPTRTKHEPSVGPSATPKQARGKRKQAKSQSKADPSRAGEARSRSSRTKQAVNHPTRPTRPTDSATPHERIEPGMLASVVRAS